jgi:transcriptional regulator with XRE-family HTH domain
MNLEVLKRAMTDKNISKSQLIKLSGVSEPTVRRIMHGKTDVHISTLRMIADALGVDPADLMDTDSPIPEAFDVSNVPEISAVVLETLTIAEESVTSDVSVTNDAPSNGTPVADDAPSFDEQGGCDASVITIREPETDLYEPLKASYLAHIATLRRIAWILAGVSGTLLAVVLVLAVALAAGG